MSWTIIGDSSRAIRVYPELRSAVKRAAESCAVSATPCSSPISVKRASRASRTSQSHPRPAGASPIVRGSRSLRSASSRRSCGLLCAWIWARRGAAACPITRGPPSRNTPLVRSRSRLLIVIALLLRRWIHRLLDIAPRHEHDAVVLQRLLELRAGDDVVILLA